MSDLTKKIVIGIVYTALVASCTYYFSPTKVKTETKTVTVEVTKEVESSNTKTKTITKTKPDGSSITVTTTDNSTNTTTDTNIDSTTDTTKTVERATDGVTISALAGIDITNPAKGIAFGASISRPMLGPITVGIWGLSSGTGGVSLGLKF